MIMEEEIRRLPDSELEVMQAVWSCTPPVSRNAIENALPQERSIATTTLLTLLTRLAEKSFLKIEKKRRGSVYIPLVSRHDYLSAQSSRFVEKLCGGSISVFASALIDSGLSKADISELRRLLEEDLL